MQSKLQLELVIRCKDSTVHTALKVFDQKSYESCLLAVRKGFFGKYSRRSYYLEGTYLHSTYGWTNVYFPVFVVAGRQVIIYNEQNGTDFKFQGSVPPRTLHLTPWLPAVVRSMGLSVPEFA